MPLCDAHNHLQNECFSFDRDAVLERAERAGVARLAVNGTAPSDWDGVAELADAYPAVTPFFGLHPWFISQASCAWQEALADTLARYPQAGVGEVGLDRCVHDLDDELQESVLREQLDVARAFDRPVTLHCVKAWGRLLELLQAMPSSPRGVLLHACAAPAEMVPDFLRVGAYFSFSGAVLSPRQVRMRRTLCTVPLDRLLLETDAPNQPFGEGEDRSEPSLLARLVAGVAAFLGEPETTLQGRLWLNAEAFFGG
ncbi:MAG: TatD family hydrolase [Planctomycetota bacterium]|jgi:TatD DNase family protein